MNADQQRVLRRCAASWLVVMMIALALSQLGRSGNGLINAEYKRFNRFVSWSG